MLRTLGFLIGGVALLYFGAEWLVRGSSGLAVKLRVRPLLIGLTVVAYGTSAPELAVSVTAGLAGRSGIAFGNAIGSSIANLGLILGVTALVRPLAIDPSLRRRDLPALLLSTVAIPLLLIDGRVSRIEGAALVFAAVAYTFFVLRGARDQEKQPTTSVDEAREVAEEARILGAVPKTDSTAKLVIISLVGLGGLLVGGDLFVDGASALARAVGISERIVGLTIVAVGTSLPEFATSLIATRRGHGDIAIGNVIGSNIFNGLLILGASGVVGPLDVSLGEARSELVGLVIVTLVATFVLGRSAILSRTHGAILLALYVLFLAVLTVRP